MNDDDPIDGDFRFCDRRFTDEQLRAVRKWRRLNGLHIEDDRTCIVCGRHARGAEVIKQGAGCQRHPVPKDSVGAQR